MRIALVGQMVASSQAFERLGKELLRRGCEIASFLANGKQYPFSEDEMLFGVCGSDVLVTGMASSAELAKEELAAISAAAAAGKPVACYSDTYGTWARPHFASVREGVAALFVINGEEEREACTAGFKTVVASGNPVWEDFYFPAVTREEVRQKLGIADDETMVLVPFGKDLVVNILHAGGVIEATSRIARDDSRWFVVILGIHPGDKNPLELYQGLMGATAVIVRIVPKSEMPSSQVLVGADLVVESASTLGIEAAHLRIPVVDYFTEIALSRMEASSGSRRWGPCELCVAIPIYGGSVDKLAQVIEDILNFSDAQPLPSRTTLDLLVRQEAVYPRPPEKGTAVKIMADTLERLVGV